jgi:site-specific recombinase XerD
VLDYTAWLQDLDEESEEPLCHPRTVAKQLSAIRGFARWLSMTELPVDPRIQCVRVKAGPPPAPRALSPEQLRTLLANARPRDDARPARSRDPRGAGARRAAALGAVHAAVG